MARFEARQPASRNGRRFWTPKELAAELSDVSGVPVSERMIVRRCALPASDPSRIVTVSGFFGRYYIPEAEGTRLILAVRSEASA